MDISEETVTKLFEDYIVVYGMNLVFAILIFIIGKWIANVVTKLVKTGMTKSKVDSVLVDFVSGIIKSILVLFVIIASLGELGVDTTSLVALIGAAGLAIGLSLQSSLQNFASGVMLIMFRPFTTGDFIEAAGISGVVEKITIFNTMMRTGDNKELIVPNGAIYGGVIVNYSAKSTRRIDMVFGIGYGDDIKKAKEIMQEILVADERVLDEPESLIALSELADSSVNFIVRPWVKSGDYWAVKFDVTEKVKLAFDEAGISIPYPQMDIHLSKEG
ncbi:MAG: mechanosensitive ion channel protein MscS [Gammaproteobacteria bacterium]|nr:MAG: mechanosensitive ion channel protein MscS [Gammaproteobacteria bacterium]